MQAIQRNRKSGTKLDYIFVAANPLQILMSTSIIRQLNLTEKAALIIHGDFTGSKEIAGRFIPSKILLSGLQIIYVDHRADAFSYINREKPCEIFIDGDVGFKNFTILLLLKVFNHALKINVFEEGVGTYRNDLYHGVKKSIFKIIGIGTTFGGCILTSCVFVTNPSRYKNIFPRCLVDVKLIKDGPAKVLEQQYASWKEIFNYTEIQNINHRQCGLFLTTWDFNLNSIKKLLALDCDRYIKPHPRCKVEISVPGVVVLETSAPAEMVIYDLAKKYFQVYVYHHGSSVEQYFSSSNVVFIKL